MTEGGPEHGGAAAADPAQWNGDPSGIVDPVVDLTVPARRRELAGHRLDLLGMIALGGVLGAEARYGMGILLPNGPGDWPWATLLVNVSGCLLIGVLMVVVTELTTAHRLIRPFLGVGVLGGYTTFSTATIDTLTLVDTGRPLAALGYTVATPVLALVACGLGVVVTRLLAGRSPRPPEAGR